MIYDTQLKVFGARRNRLVGNKYCMHGGKRIEVLPTDDGWMCPVCGQFKSFAKAPQEVSEAEELEAVNRYWVERH